MSTRGSVVERQAHAGGVLIALMGAGIVINYLDRVNISHALPAIAEDFALDPVAQGVTLSAFSWGYVGFMLVAGLLVDRLGPVRAAGLAAIAWSIATIWTGLSGGPRMLIASRLALGAAEAPIFPANARIVREEFPRAQRGMATGLFDAGSYLGTAISAPIVVGVILVLGWRWSFIVCGLLGLLWAAVWFRFAPNRIGAHDSGIKVARGLSARQVGLLFCHQRIMGTYLAFFAYNYTKNFYLTWMPIYLIRERGISFAQVGLVGAIPPLAAILGDVAGGWFTDRLVRSGKSLTVARKLPLCLGLVLGGTLAFAPLIDSNTAVLLLLAVAFACTSSVAAVLWTLPGDFSRSPHTVGTLGGIQNTVANVAGIIAPIATGAVLAHTGSFAPALLLYAVVACAGAVLHLLLVDEVGPLPERLVGVDSEP